MGDWIGEVVSSIDSADVAAAVTCEPVTLL